MTQVSDQSLSADQFIATSEEHPSGEGDFTPEMFGKDAVTLENRVLAWIKKAGRETTVVKAQAHYVRHYGWSAAADFVAAQPMMVNTDNGFFSKQRATSQLEHFQTKAAQELALAKQAEADEGQEPVTQKVRTRFYRRERPRF